MGALWRYPLSVCLSLYVRTRMESYFQKSIHNHTCVYIYICEDINTEREREHVVHTFTVYDAYICIHMHASPQMVPEVHLAALWPVSDSQSPRSVGLHHGCCRGCIRLGHGSAVEIKVKVHTVHIQAYRHMRARMHLTYVNIQACCSFTRAYRHIYIYMYIHIYIYTHKYHPRGSYMPICTSVYIYICSSVCICTGIYFHIHMIFQPEL